MSLTNEVQYPEPAASGYLFANKAQDGTVTYLWQAGGSDQPGAPSLSVASGTYAQGQTVTITSTTTDASIYYTTDGSVPTTAATLYTSPIRIKDSCTLSAVAVSNGFSYSTVTSAAYTIVRRIVTTMQTSSYSAVLVLTSDDSGSTWSGFPIPCSQYATRVASLKGNTVLSGSYIWATSTDHGGTFTNVPCTINSTYWPTRNNTDIYVLNNMFVGYFGYNQNNTTYTAYIGVSATGAYFKYLSIPVTQQPNYSNSTGANTSNMAYYNGIYLVWLGNCMLKSTDNCTSFTAITSMPFSSNIDMKSTAYGFVVGNSSNIYTSTDGASWTQSSLGVSYSNYNYTLGIMNDAVIAYNNSAYPLISYDGGVTFSQPAGSYSSNVMDYAQSDIVYAETGYFTGNTIVQQRQIKYKSAVSPVTHSSNTGYRITWNGSKFVALDNSGYIIRIGNAPDTSETLSTLNTYLTANSLNLNDYTLATITDTESSTSQDTQQVVPSPTVTKSAPYTQVYLSDSGSDAFTTSFTEPNCGCYNPTTGLLYIVPNSDTMNIKSINPATGAYANLTTPSKGYLGLVYCSTDGFLYGCVNGSYVYKINSTTGVETQLTSTTRYWTNLTYNPTNSLLYGVCHASSYAYSNTSVYSISLTGTETLITAASTYTSIQGISYDNNGSVLLENYDGSVVRLSTSNVVTTVGTCIDHGTYYAVTKAVTFNSTYVGLSSQYLVGVSADGTTSYVPNPATQVVAYKLLIAAGSQLYAIVDEYVGGVLANANRLRLVTLGTTSYNYVDATITGDPNLLPILFGTLDGSDPTPTTQTRLSNNGLTLQNTAGTLQNLVYTYGVYGILSNVTIPKLVAGSLLKVFAYVPNYSISPVVTTTL